MVYVRYWDDNTTAQISHFYIFSMAVTDAQATNFGVMLKQNECMWFVTE